MSNTRFELFGLAVSAVWVLQNCVSAINSNGTLPAYCTGLGY